MKAIIKAVVLSVFLTSQVISNLHANEQAQVCAACHGATGISSDQTVPNLAGQHKVYLISQLKAFKSKQRNNAIMNAIAANLSDDDINALATFFSQQSKDKSQIDKVTNKDALGSILKNSRLAFPADFPSGYSEYTTVNRADNKQVRFLYLDNASLQAFKDNGALPNNSTLVMAIYKAKLNEHGEALEGQDGFYQKDTLAAYAVMKKELGWGDKLPKEIRNADWKYGFFKPNKEHHPTRNIAKCMACHQPLSDQEFMFSFDSLKNRP